MHKGYRIVFAGQIRKGLDPLKIRAKLASRLSVSELQASKMFSGKRVVLKNGVSEEEGRNYIERLAHLGMIVTLEPVKTQPYPTLPPVEEESTVPHVTPPPRPAEEASWLSHTSLSNLARTHLNLSRAEALLDAAESSHDEPEPAPAPTQEVAPKVTLEATAAPTRPPVMEPPTPPVPPAPPAAAAPAQTATLVFAPPAPGHSLTLSGAFVCSHCGTVHQLEARLVISPPAPTAEKS